MKKKLLLLGLAMILAAAVGCAGLLLKFLYLPPNPWKIGAGKAFNGFIRHTQGRRNNHPATGWFDIEVHILDFLLLYFNGNFCHLHLHQ